MMQQSLYHHPGLLAAPQIEPILRGNLAPGFDSSMLGTFIPRLQILFFKRFSQVQVPLKDAISLDKRSFGQPIKVNWAYASSQSHYNIFVGDLSPEVTDATLFACFSVYPICSDVRVMWDQKTGHSPGCLCYLIGQEAQGAINDLNGIYCTEEGQEKAYDDNPEMNPQYTTVYVGNLAPEVTSVQLHLLFHALDAGTIEDVGVQRDKGFGFVRYSTHDEAALAIQMGSARILSGKPIKCLWASKPTPPGTVSSPLSPPAAAHMPVFSAYQGRMALSKMGGAQAHMHQHALKQAPMGMGAPAASSGALPTSQHLMYYQ